MKKMLAILCTVAMLATMAAAVAVPLAVSADEGGAAALPSYNAAQWLNDEVLPNADRTTIESGTIWNCSVVTSAAWSGFVTATKTNGFAFERDFSAYPSAVKEAGNVGTVHGIRSNDGDSSTLNSSFFATDSEAKFVVANTGGNWGDAANTSSMLTFTAPYTGTVSLNDLSAGYIGDIGRYASFGQVAKSNAVRRITISYDGQKIWPVDADYAELNKSNQQIQFPDISLDVTKGKNIEIKISFVSGLWIPVVLNPTVTYTDVQSSTVYTASGDILKAFDYFSALSSGDRLMNNYPANVDWKYETFALNTASGETEYGLAANHEVFPNTGRAGQKSLDDKTLTNGGNPGLRAGIGYMHATNTGVNFATPYLALWLGIVNTAEYTNTAAHGVRLIFTAPESGSILLSDLAGGKMGDGNGKEVANLWSNNAQTVTFDKVSENGNTVNLKTVSIAASRAVDFPEINADVVKGDKIIITVSTTGTGAWNCCMMNPSVTYLPSAGDNSKTLVETYSGITRGERITYFDSEDALADISAPVIDGKEFLYWVVGNKKIDTKNASLLLDAGGVTANAVYSGLGEDKCTVTFETQFDAKIIKSETLTTKNADDNWEITVPEAPIKKGYTFKGWNYEEIDGTTAVIDGNVKHMIIRALYERTDNTTYTVTPIGCDVSATSGTYNQKIIATPSGAGVFKGWKLNNVLISTEPALSFFISGNVTVEAVYDAEVTVGTAAQIYDNVLTANGEKFNWSIFVANTAAAGDTVLDAGVEFAASPFAEASKIQSISSSRPQSEQLVISLNNITAGRTRYARAFLTVKHADGTLETVYGSEIHIVAAQQ